MGVKPAQKTGKDIKLRHLTKKPPTVRLPVLCRLVKLPEQKGYGLLAKLSATASRRGFIFFPTLMQ